MLFLKILSKAGPRFITILVYQQPFVGSTILILVKRVIVVGDHSGCMNCRVGWPNGLVKKSLRNHEYLDGINI